MKSINNFIGLALLSGALLTSCSDSFLQRDSLTESSSTGHRTKRIKRYIE